MESSSAPSSSESMPDKAQHKTSEWDRKFSSADPDNCYPSADRAGSDIAVVVVDIAAEAEQL